MAGATTPEALSKDDLVGMIEETGHTAVERDTLYRIVKFYSDEAEAPVWNAGPIGAAPLIGVFPKDEA
jgi:2-iminoacetate synthase ThiH